MKKCLIILTVLLLLAVGAFAQAPNEISYQGKLTNADGAPITTSSSVTFAIYAASAGGTAIYTSTQTITPDENGIFTVNLAGVDGTDFNGSIRYLGIKVGSDDEMTPRQRINSAPYSYSTQNIPSNSVNSANIVDNSITSNDILNSTIVGADIANGSITDADIADEPGIAHSFSSSSVVIATSVTVIDSIEFTAPTAGFVLLQATGSSAISANGTGVANMNFSISASTVFDYDNQCYIDLGIPSARTYYQPISTIVADPVTAGAHKFYLLGFRSSTSTSASAFRTHFIATFFPTNYGTVDNTTKSVINNSSQPQTVSD